MPDDVISLDAFREKKLRKDSEGGEETEIVSFQFSPDALETLDAMTKHLEAPSRGETLSVAMEILRITLSKLDGGCAIIAVDEDGDGAPYFVDPRTVFTTSKTPA